MNDRKAQGSWASKALAWYLGRATVVSLTAQRAFSDTCLRLVFLYLLKQSFQIITLHHQDPRGPLLVALVRDKDCPRRLMAEVTQRSVLA